MTINSVAEYEEKKRLFYELLANRRKPTPVLTVPVSERVARAAAQARESVRVAVRDSDGVTLFEKPRVSRVQVRVDWVREVDPEGRPVWRQAGATHAYDPIAALRGESDR